MIYSVVVKNKNGQSLGEFDTFSKLVIGKRLNNYGVCSITLPVSEQKANTLVSLRQNTVWIYRDNVLVWSGEMAMRSASLNVDGSGTCELIAYTWFEKLRQRQTQQYLRYEQVDAGQIAWDLIYRTQNQYIGSETNATYPATASTSNAIGTIDWSLPNNIKVYDDSPAYLDYGGSEKVTYYLKATNFGFSIPSNADINGIQVNVTTLNDKGVSGDYSKDSTVKLIKAGVVQSTNRGENVDQPTTVTTSQYGNQNDLWGDSWDYNDINDSGFGVALSYTGKGSIMNVYAVSIVIYYSTPTVSVEADMGITQGTIEASMGRDRTYENQTISEAIINLTNVISGFDFEITDNKVFNVKNVIGEDKTQDVILDYGSNVLTCQIVEDYTEPVNRAIVVGQTSDSSEILRVERDDETIQNSIGLREAIITEWDVSETETLNEKGDALIRKQGNVLYKIDIDIMPNTPNISQFSLGDSIKLRIVHGFYNIVETYRVFEWEVTYEDDGTEKLRLVLGKFTL